MVNVVEEVVFVGNFIVVVIFVWWRWSWSLIRHLNEWMCGYGFVEGFEAFEWWIVGSRED